MQGPDPNSGTPGIVKLAMAIARREGFGIPKTVPTRFNNPGDLMYAHQAHADSEPVAGADGKLRIYAKFKSIADGWAALEAQIRLDAGRGLTLEQFIHKYAPASDGNDPKSYLAGVMRQIGCPNAHVKLADLIQ